jgi:hypothetical protein
LGPRVLDDVGLSRVDPELWEPGGARRRDLGVGELDLGGRDADLVPRPESEADCILD